MKHTLNLVLKIFLEPHSLWKEQGPPDVPSLWQALFPMSFITAAIPAISLFIGNYILGSDLGPFGRFHYPFGPALLVALLFYLLLVAGIVALGGLIYKLGRLFKMSNAVTFEQSVMTANVVSVPLFLGGLFLMYADMTPLWFLSGLYGVYLLKSIAENMCGIEHRRSWQFAIAVFVLYYVLVVGLSHTVSSLVADAFTPSIAEILQSIDQRQVPPLHQHVPYR